MMTIAKAVGFEVDIMLRQKLEPRCSCCDGTSTEAEIVSRHGTLASFEMAVHKAVPEFLSYQEAEESAEKYRLDLNHAADRDKKKDTNA